MRNPIVFISYCHETEEHKDKVLSLSERLRKDGVETRLDRYVQGTPNEGWPRWMLNQLDEADYVLVVCTATYYRRFRGHEVGAKGKGADWEGALITQELYDSKSTAKRFIPLLFDRNNDQFIPEPLRAATFYPVTSEEEYESLYNLLRGNAGVEPGPIGELKPIDRIHGIPLIFGQPKREQQLKVDISRIDRYAPANLVGREDEFKLLNDAWNKAVKGEKGRPHVLTFVAMGGEGKTSLVAKWVAEMAHQEWQGCDIAFAWSFYSQGTRDTASSDVFFKEALTFFGDSEMANSTQGAYEKGRRLGQIIGEKNGVLILDGLEPLQHAPTSTIAGELKDQGISGLLKALAAKNKGLCLITTRCEVRDLRVFWQNTAPQIKLSRLSEEASRYLLQSLGVKGAAKDFLDLARDVKGHALTLNLIGSYLRHAHGGDIRRRDLIKISSANDDFENGHAFRVIEAYAKWFESEGNRGFRALALLRLLGLFDRPATFDCITALLSPPSISGMTKALVGINEPDINKTLSHLEATGLISIGRNEGVILSIDAHPLIREYFSKERQLNHREAWRTAHRRIYEHLKISTKEGENPSLEELQPLYQAIVHGCHAGLQQDACENIYRKRILKNTKGYSTHKLGAYSSDLGAITCFFEDPWNRPSSSLNEIARTWLYNEAGYRLRSLGRLNEALKPIRLGLTSHLDHRRFNSASRLMTNSSEIELLLGNIEAALRDAIDALAFAKQATFSDAAFLNITSNASLGNALLQHGKWQEAYAYFLVAEDMQKKIQPNYPLVYSVQGFHFNDFLLAPVEQMAWRIFLNEQGKSKTDEAIAGAPVSVASSALLKVCAQVLNRATTILHWAEQNQLSLLDAALNQLTIGCAKLFAGILSDSSAITFGHGIDLHFAVKGLRQTNAQDQIPLGLLARAWLNSANGLYRDAQSDLDEAWEIAERGPMRLFMADIHLSRARLFFREGNYPWESPKADLEAAEKLINNCAYHRRDEELADAKKVILGM